MCQSRRPLTYLLLEFASIVRLVSRDRLAQVAPGLGGEAANIDKCVGRRRVRIVLNLIAPKSSRNYLF